MLTVIYTAFWLFVVFMYILIGGIVGRLIHKKYDYMSFGNIGPESLCGGLLWPITIILALSFIIYDLVEKHLQEWWNK